MDGIILVDKPAGLSSYDVIRQLKKAIPGEKIGHAGTLDPMATGLLIILVGTGCKQAGEFLKLDKSYAAKITLGSSSDTDDPEGKIIKTSNQEPKIGEIQSVIASFIGEIKQVPPQYSAIKVGGQRAYKLARSGELVKLKERQTTIYELQIISYKYPILHIETSVSSGTYIRSLARDIGQKLGCGGYLSYLRRLSIGKYQVQNSVQLGHLTRESIKKNIIQV